MGDVLKKVHFVVECHTVKEHQVLMNLAHVANMRNDRQLELLCHQTDG
jgi:hypothetical protein